MRLVVMAKTDKEIITETWEKLIEPPVEKEEPTDWRKDCTDYELQQMALGDEADARRKGE
jgi:hypothetical protein